MEIEVGDYVRLARNQGINKVIEIENLVGIKRYILEEEIADEYGDIINVIDEDELNEEIVKHSKDIIDLVEENDFINGRKVLEVRRTDKNIYLMTSYAPQEYMIVTSKSIKSILTHEQYENNAYRLEE